MAKGLDGATTVSATMLLAARAGIQVFVTGGAVFYEPLPHRLLQLSALCRTTDVEMASGS